jgi:hypothetical protein
MRLALMTAPVAKRGSRATRAGMFPGYDNEAACFSRTAVTALLPHVPWNRQDP